MQNTRLIQILQEYDAEKNQLKQSLRLGLQKIHQEAFNKIRDLCKAQLTAKQYVHAHQTAEKLASIDSSGSGEHILAYMTIKGLGCDSNPEKAREYYLKAAEKGLAIAMYLYAEMLYYGQGGDKELDNAVSWYEKAANKGYALATCRYGNALYLGAGVEKNLEEAGKCWIQSSEQGLPTSLYHSAIMSYYGEGGVQSIEDSKVMITRANEKGVSISVFLSQALSAKSTYLPRRNMGSW